MGGKTRLLAEKGNIAVSGSSLVSQDDLLLKAGGDIDIRAAEHRQSQSERQVSSGIGSAVISDTEHFSGWMKNRRENEGKETRQAASQIGSLKGGVRIDAGGAYRQTGSDVAAARDIDISAQSVDIRAADNHGRSRQSERDLKIGTFAKISSPLIDLVNAAEGAAKSKADDRTRALQGLAAGAQAYQLADGVGKVADAVKNQTGQQGAVLLSVEAGFGFKTASKEQNQNYRQSRESSLKAGGDINIRSREGDITVQGSNITAGDTIRLDSARDIRLLSAQDSQHQDGKNRNAGVQVGVGVSVGAQTGVYIYAEAAYGKGKNRSDSQTHQNTLLQSDKLQLSSKGNTVLNGAQAHAKRIDAEVGGTLHIESPQDTVEQAINEKRAAAVNEFENSTKKIITDEIMANSKEKLDSLNNELEMTKQSLGSIASRRSEINLAISDKYESYLGRDFLQAEKIEALQKLISDKEAANISDAIDLYQKRQMDKK